MATIPEITDRLEAATEKAENASQIIYDVANGDASTEVPTASGPTPTLKKWFQDLGSTVEPMLAGIPARLDQAILSYETLDEAQAAAATLPDGQIIASDGDEVRAIVAGGVLTEEESIYRASVYAKVRSYSGRGTRLRVLDSTGAHWWVRRGSASDNGGTVLKDALDRSWEREFSGSLNALWFGAVGDGIAVDTEPLLRARIASIGKELFFPNGTYLTDRWLISDISDVHVTGENKYLTTIKLLPNISNHAVEIVNAARVTFQSIGIDQNSAGKSAGHGIRVGGVDGLNLVDIVIRNCYGYGIGFQAGANKNVFISHFEIHNTGQDGIDFKDFLFGNESVTITAGLISEYGVLQSNQAGIDIRGPANVSTVHLKSSASVFGLRLRHAGDQGRAGSGNFSDIYAELSGTSQAIATGADCVNFNIINVTSVGCSLGTLDGKSGNLANLTCLNSPGDALSIFGKDLDIQGLLIDGATRAIDMEPGATGNSISKFNLKNISGSVAVRVQGTADDNSFINGRVQAGKSISDSGNNTIIDNVKGFKTSAKLISTDIAVDSTGNKTFVFTHGLAVTPKSEDITLTIIRSTGSPNDYRIGLFQLDGSPSATEFVARIYVSTASATPGAAIKIAATIRSK